MHKNQTCYCGSNVNFKDCCQAFITYLQSPKTPEQLMRSRFSAYAMGEHSYIFNTYGVNQRAKIPLNDISTSSENCTWLALKIHDTDNEQTSEQFVEFSAFYITDNILCEMREKSRFILERDNKCEVEQWRYIDGKILKNTKLTIIKRNDLCPCNNYPGAYSKKQGKKLKHCCGS